MSDFPPVPLTLEGSALLHQFFRFDWKAWRATTQVDRDRIARQRERLVVGSMDTARKRLQSLIAATQADELMITTMVYDHAARRRSYELLAKAFGLVSAA